jgi:hypothetical protein
VRDSSARLLACTPARLPARLVAHLEKIRLSSPTLSCFHYLSCNRSWSTNYSVLVSDLAAIQPAGNQARDGIAHAN